MNEIEILKEAIEGMRTRARTTGWTPEIAHAIAALAAELRSLRQLAGPQVSTSPAKKSVRRG
jgi:hypothetical protein